MATLAIHSPPPIIALTASRSDEPPEPGGSLAADLRRARHSSEADYVAAGLRRERANHPGHLTIILFSRFCILPLRQSTAQVRMPAPAPATPAPPTRLEVGLLALHRLADLYRKAAQTPQLAVKSAPIALRRPPGIYRWLYLANFAAHRWC